MNFRNLLDESKKIDNIVGEDKIKLNKMMSSYIKEAKEKAKKKECLYCNKKVDSFCKSHLVPAFCLRNIDENGKVLNFNSLIKFPIYLKETNGGSKCRSVLFYM